MILADPNIVAYVALLLCVPIALCLFAVLRTTTAVVVVLLGSMLLLPVRTAFDFPGLPAFNKELIGNLAALCGCLLFARSAFLGQRIGRGLDSFIILMMFGAALTPFMNRDPLVYGPTVLPGMGPWDAISASITQFLHLGIPFILGRVFFKRSMDLRLLCILIVAAGLVYSLPIIWEARMSPQLHRSAYGYLQHHFRQTERLGGYRPMVFMAHGLALSAFVLVTLISATSLARIRAWIAVVPAAAAAVYLTGILAICRALTSMVYGLAVIPFVVFARPRRQLQLATLLAALVLAYPVTRAAGLFPVGATLSLAAVVDEQRAQSLGFRFQNEDELLEKAGHRIWLGWGTYRRNRVFDPVTGEDLSVTDGFWIIQLGSQGIVGFVGAFGLLLVPLFLANRGLSRIRSNEDRMLIASLSLALVVFSIDLLPNGFLSPFTVFLAGALTGLIPGLQAEERRRAPPDRQGDTTSPPRAGPPQADSRRPTLRDLRGSRRPRFPYPQGRSSYMACPGIGSRR